LFYKRRDDFSESVWDSVSGDRKDAVELDVKALAEFVRSQDRRHRSGMFDSLNGNAMFTSISKNVNITPAADLNPTASQINRKKRRGSSDDDKDSMRRERFDAHFSMWES
jgi:hypothetical protein